MALLILRLNYANDAISIYLTGEHESDLTNSHSLDKIQNQALRIITGAMKSTPIAFMEQTTSTT